MFEQTGLVGKLQQTLSFLLGKPPEKYGLSPYPGGFAREVEKNHTAFLEKDFFSDHVESF